jgi:hypothetical protein
MKGVWNVMKIRRWMEKTKDREQWGLVVEEAVAPREWMDSICRASLKYIGLHMFIHV